MAIGADLRANARASTVGGPGSGELAAVCLAGAPASPYHAAMASTLRRAFPEDDRAFCRLLALLAYTNPFLPVRIDLERAILRDAFVDPGRFMSPGANPRETHENVRLITALLKRTMPGLRERYLAAEVSAADRADYVGTCFYFLYDSYDEQFQPLIDGRLRKAPFFKAFKADYQRYLGFLGKAEDLPEPALVFAIFYQIRRAFHFLYTNVRGRSLPVAYLRAQIWNAIFGGGLDDYALGMWDRMDRLSTLIHGPSGTGKELAAKAIALSGYVPFHEKSMTFSRHDHYYGAINLSALSSGLMESELFGHRQGAFTGADRDKKGLIEMVQRYGAVLLDEIAEIDERMQVTLLRVLQERVFRHVGEEEEEIAMLARLLTATHRDLSECLSTGEMREDFFRRFCLLQIRTPSLRERFDDMPGELAEVMSHLAVELVGERRAGRLTDQVVTYVEKHLPDHPWTGNVREALQCVASVWVTGVYVPMRIGGKTVERKPEGLEEALARAGLPLDEVGRRYAAGTLATTGSLAETARVLGVDVRRVRRILARGEGEE